jgi:hypothetical protein
MQYWYKKYYEKTLFKESKELQNILGFISRNINLKPEKEIIKTLKKAGWTYEQINYALKKHKGKKIMWEIPIGFSIKNKKQKKIKNNQERKPVPFNNTVFRKPEMRKPIENKEEGQNQEQKKFKSGFSPFKKE